MKCKIGFVSDGRCRSGLYIMERVLNLQRMMTAFYGCGL